MEKCLVSVNYTHCPYWLVEIFMILWNCIVLNSYLGFIKPKSRILYTLCQDYVLIMKTMLYFKIVWKHILINEKYGCPWLDLSTYWCIWICENFMYLYVRNQVIKWLCNRDLHGLVLMFYLGHCIGQLIYWNLVFKH